MRQHRAALIAVVAAGALILGGGAWAAFAHDGERSPEDTVAAFFDARQRGDCEGLLDLTSEASWSEDGVSSRDEFLEACADAVEAYQPELHEVHLRSEADDQAVVQVEVAIDENQPTELGAPGPRVEGIVVQEYGVSDRIETEALAYEYGRLVSENGEWKVVLDEHAFGLGSSVEQTVWGYLEAYRDGDCERLLDHLSEEVWSAGGETDRAEFLESCSAAAQGRPTPPSDDDLPLLAETPLIAMPQTIEVTPRADGATAEIPWARGLRTETVDLVVEDLQWKVAGTVEAFAYVELGNHLLSRPLGLKPDLFGGPTPVYPNGESDYGLPLEVYEGDDAVEQQRRTGFERGFAVNAGPWDRSVELLLYEFADSAGARAYARHLTDRIVARSTEYDDVSPVPVPGVQGATAIVTECSGSSFRHRSAGGDCSRANKAATVAASGHYLVAVEAVDFKGTDATAAGMRGMAITALKAQLDRL
jgi:hypothetical protein